MRVEEDGAGVCLLHRVLQAFLAEGVVCGDDGKGLRAGAYLELAPLYGHHDSL